jgi:hypothetical protein
VSFISPCAIGAWRGDLIYHLFLAPSSSIGLLHRLLMHRPLIVLLSRRAASHCPLVAPPSRPLIVLALLSSCRSPSPTPSNAVECPLLRRLSTRRPLVVSSSRRAASCCLIAPAGCRIIISRCPLIAPPSCPLIVLGTTTGGTATARGSRATGGTTMATGGMTTARSSRATGGPTMATGSTTTVTGGTNTGGTTMLLRMAVQSNWDR